MIDCDKLKTGSAEMTYTAVRGSRRNQGTADICVGDGGIIISVNDRFRSGYYSLIRFTADELRKMADAVEAVDAKQQEKIIRCYFCQTSIPTVDEAIEAGWIPSFYDGESQYSTPVCNKCVDKHIEWNDDFGEYQLKKG